MDGESFFDWMTEELIEGMRQLVCAMIAAFLHFVYNIVAAMFSVLPTEWTITFGRSLAEGLAYWNWVDKYVPLNRMLALWATYMAWIVAVRVTAYVVKLIRG